MSASIVLDTESQYARCALGSWDDRGSEPQVDIPALEKHSGVVVFQLRTSPGETLGVHEVEVQTPIPQHGTSSPYTRMDST